MGEQLKQRPLFDNQDDYNLDNIYWVDVYNGINDYTSKKILESDLPTLGSKDQTLTSHRTVYLTNKTLTYDITHPLSRVIYDRSGNLGDWNIYQQYSEGSFNLFIKGRLSGTGRFYLGVDETEDNRSGIYFNGDEFTFRTGTGDESKQYGIRLETDGVNQTNIVGIRSSRNGSGRSWSLRNFSISTDYINFAPNTGNISVGVNDFTQPILPRFEVRGQGDNFIDEIISFKNFSKTPFFSLRGDGTVIIGSNALIGSEDISLQGTTLVGDTGDSMAVLGGTPKTRGAAISDAVDLASAITAINSLLSEMRVTGGFGFIND